MKTVKISLNSIDKVKSFVNALTKFDADFDLVSGRFLQLLILLNGDKNGTEKYACCDL